MKGGEEEMENGIRIGIMVAVGFILLVTIFTAAITYMCEEHNNIAKKVLPAALLSVAIIITAINAMVMVKPTV